MEVKLQVVTPEAELNIVRIARVSSSRENKDEAPEGLINYLIKNKHWSPFEHASMTVEIVTSKAIGIQLLRHRSFTFQEFSQRYAEVEEFEDIELRLQADKNRQSSTESIGGITWVKGYPGSLGGETSIRDTTDKRYMQLINTFFLHLRESKRLYKELISEGVAKECARMILPMCTQTTIYMTGTIRSWVHFLEIRDDSHAQLEIQLIAKEIKKIFKEQFPVISKALNY